MSKKQRDLSDSDWVKFLGTAGARFVMIKQLRFSGGLWLHFKGKDIMLDPGPGALVRCVKSRPPLDPTKLDACILTHRHLDHSNDINVMIEAMTEGGFKKRGFVFCPQDCLEQDPVIFKYIREFPRKIEIFEEGKSYKLGDLTFSTPIKNKHSVQTFGLVFDLGYTKISFISDTGFFEELIPAYKAQIMVINLVFFNRREQYLHLCLDDARRIIKETKPQKAILTHFGMTMLRNDPRKIAQELSDNTGVEVISSYDGMTLVLEG